jgi:hypothetical protein
MQPDPMNSMIRQAGNRSRALPNIGQTPAVQVANAIMGQSSAPMPPPMGSTPPPGMPPQGGAAPAMPVPGAAPASPMAAPQIQPSTFTLHPPGSPSDPSNYNYEPQADGSWRVYPPGVGAPPHTFQASLPRAASTADYRRMRQAFEQTAR